MASSRLLLVLKLLMLVLLAGWVCVWMLKPTQFWKRSWHAAEDRASRTFLGDVGLHVLVFCYPVLALAVLGYIYMHLLSREGRRVWQRPSISIIKLSNPIFVSSPLGVISGAELLAAALFAVLLAWTFYFNISSDFKRTTTKLPIFLHFNRWQIKVMSMGIRLGSLAEICLAILLLPVLRGMAVFKMVGVQFEGSVRYHIWIGNVMILLAASHGLSIMFVWAIKHKLWSEITKWQRTGRVNLAGGITLATGLVIWITSLPQIRRKQFQLFYTTHHLYIVFIIFFLLHGGDRHFYLVLSGVLLLALDKILRIMQSRPTTCLISAQILQCRAIELTLSKKPGMKYTPTSLLFIKIPSISIFQWHPFSITSSSNMDDEKISLTVKCQGQWTDALYDKIKSMLDSGATCTNCLPVAVEGPYGPPTNLYQRYDNLLLIAGGSGITPLLSILQDVASCRKGNMIRHPTRIQLVYAVKKSQDLSMLTSVSPLLLSQSTNYKPGLLKLKVFVTQEEEERPGITLRELLLQEMSQVQTIVFGTKCAINSAPRPEGLLRMAVIAGLSSVIFLISLLCLSHAFLSSAKKANQIKSPSWVNDLVVVSSLIIAISCSTVATIFSRKKRKPENDISIVAQKHAAGEEMQSKDLEAMEEEEHDIYFGKRPNLIDLLEELSSQTGGTHEVGVFVCGPDSMQESVAAFCRKNSSHKFDKGSKIQKQFFTFHSVKFSL